MALCPETHQVRRRATTPKPDCLLFDFGGVLVHWDGIEPLTTLTERRLTVEQARLFWLKSPWVRRFETGRCTPSEFGAGVVQELSVRVTPEHFLAAFESWDRGPLPGAVELLQSLWSRIRLMCLSNNNVLHWNRPAIQPLIRCFEHCFVSFEIGLMKPDPEVFRFVVRASGIPADRILFFDDNPECVEAARQTGMLASEARGVGMVREKLAELGLLPG